MDKKIFFVAVLFFVSVASASFIRMTADIQVEPIVSGSSTKVNVSLVNSGDEPAHDTQLSLILPDGFSTDSAYAGVMYPNAPYENVFGVNISGGLLPGRYPLVLKIHYSDANAYPFSVVSPSFIMYEQATPVMVRGSMPELQLGVSEEKQLKLSLSNMDSKPHNLKVRLITSDEIVSDPHEKEVQINANGQTDLMFNVKPFGALPDSTYVVFATIEYDDSLHYSSIATGVVKVVREESGLNLSWLPVAVLLILIGLFIYYQLKR